MKQIHT
jgi:hypothetical protein